MNSRDIAKFHKYLEQDVSISECSKSLGVDKKTLALFTPDAIKKSKDAIAEAKKPKAAPATK